MHAPTDWPPVTLVVPCYDEARRLDVAAFVRALDAWPALRLLFVDDGSTDDTRAVLDGLAAARPARASVLALPRNGGKAGAVWAGLRHALADAPADAAAAHATFASRWAFDVELLARLRATTGGFSAGLSVLAVGRRPG